MYKKERDKPFETGEEVLTYHHRERIPCLECGKLLIFLPRHIWFVHEMRADEYREKWNIPKHIALAGISYLEKRSRYMKDRIEKGELDPVEQIAMMRARREQLVLDPQWRNRPGSVLKKEYARRHIFTNKIWEKSPAVKNVSVEFKAEAVRRMKNRKLVGEKVEDIAADLKISVSRLYHWLKNSG
ncbi:MucR family transcriptional regulator [Salmonella enterica]